MTVDGICTIVFGTQKLSEQLLVTDITPEVLTMISVPETA